MDLRDEFAMNYDAFYMSFEYAEILMGDTKAPKVPLSALDPLHKQKNSEFSLWWEEALCRAKYAHADMMLKIREETRKPIVELDLYYEDDE